jgi:hypothetical protein
MGRIVHQIRYGTIGLNGSGVGHRITRNSIGNGTGNLALAGSGIGARVVPSQGGASTIQGVLAPIAGAAGYRLYWGTTRSGNYPNSIDLLNNTNWSITNVVQGQTYYICYTAYDALGIESSRSWEISTVVPIPAQMRYVMKTGKDTNPGTQAQPFLTIAKAVSVMNPGDTILVGAGTYNDVLNIQRSGTPGRKITIRPMDGQSVVITGTTSGYVYVWSLNGCSYVRIEGFEFANCSAYAAVGQIGAAHHNEIVGNHIHDCSNAAIIVEGPTTALASMLLVQGNYIHDNQSGGISLLRFDGGWGRIFNNHVNNNGLSQTAGNYDGIQCGSQDGGCIRLVVKNNIASNHGTGTSNSSGADQLDLGGHAHNHHYLVEGNLVIRGTGIGSFKCHSGDLKGSGAAGPYYTPGVDGFHIIRFNQFHIGYVSYEFPNPIVAYNNTMIDGGFLFYGEGIAPLTDQSFGDSTWTRDTDTGRMTWCNNVFYNTTAQKNYITWGPPGQTIDMRYNSMRFKNDTYSFPSGSTVDWNPGNFSMPGAFNTWKNSFAPDLPETGGTLTTQTAAQMFRDLTNKDCRPLSGSDSRNAAAALTFAVGAAVTPTTTIQLDRASYFQDGYPNPNNAAELLNEPDVIQIGNNAPVQIVQVNDGANTVVLATAQTWADGAPVTLAGLKDRGAFQWVSDSQLRMPIGLATRQISVTTVTP